MTARSELHARSLEEAGIGKVYHPRRLAEVDRGDALSTWLATSGRQDIHRGLGWTVVGEKYHAHETVILLARALHLSGLKTRVVPLRRLVWHVVHQGDMLADFHDCHALAVLDFFQLYGGNPTPLTGIEVQEVEAFLHERLDAQRAVIVHSARPLNVVEVPWWSPALLSRLADSNRVWEAK